MMRYKPTRGLHEFQESVMWLLLRGVQFLLVAGLILMAIAIPINLARTGLTDNFLWFLLEVLFSIALMGIFYPFIPLTHVRTSPIQ